MFNPDTINDSHIRQAAEKIKLGTEQVKPSTIYDVIIDGERFPPKEVMRIAHGLATGNPVWTLPGGAPTNSLLEKLGFSVMTKASDFTAQRNYWKILPGELSSKWPEFLSRGIMGVAFNEFNTGDLRQYKSLKDLETAIGKENSNNAFSLWTICHAPEGDVVFANKGRDTVLGIGVITGPYEYHDNESMPHQRKVKWLADKEWEYASGQFASGRKSRPNLFRIDTLSKTDVGLEILKAYLLKYPNYEEVFTESGIWPVYEETSYDKLISRIAEYKNNELLSAYFDFLRSVFEKTNISNEDENLFCTIRKDSILMGISYKRRYISFLQLINNKLNLFLMVPINHISKNKHLNILKEGQFNGTGILPGFIQIDFTNKNQLSSDLENSMVEAIINEKKDGKINSWRPVHKNMHNDYIYKAINDLNFRNKVFEDANKYGMEVKSAIPANGKPNKIVQGSLNKILFGPPGTGKTYELQKKYFPLYTTAKTNKSREQIILDSISSMTWWEVIASVLVEMGPSKVPDIVKHEFIKIKTQLSSAKTPSNTIWNLLQHHTVKECKYVNLANRAEPLIFTKDQNSIWSLTKFATEEIPEILNLSKSIKNDSSGSFVIRNYYMTTFHQNFSYEDFIEGIKPVISDDEEGQLNYEIQKGLFYKACEKAVQLAGYASISECLEDTVQSRMERLNRAEPFAFFIDEINRANVSAVFGELITLIEDDKRLGAENEITDMKLPYSKNGFGVPCNPHILGTMNTADRSVEALDTALRRRFSFTEMPPRYDLPELDKEINGFQLATLLRTINTRIEKLLDKDHLIGHSFFINVKSEHDLKSVFQNKIIPLLQEYFFGDYGKIGLVLGSGFIENIGDDGNGSESIFADFDGYDESEYASKPVYRMINPSDMKEGELHLALRTLMRQ